MSEVSFLFLVSATYLLLGAWVIRLSSGSSKGVPVKVRQFRAAEHGRVSAHEAKPLRDFDRDLEREF